MFTQKQFRQKQEAEVAYYLFTASPSISQYIGPFLNSAAIIRSKLPFIIWLEIRTIILSQLFRVITLTPALWQEQSTAHVRLTY